MSRYFMTMTKLIILASILTASVSVAAITEYISPASSPSTAVPEIHVDLPAATVMRKLATLTSENYIGHISGENGYVPDDVAVTTQKLNDHAIKYTVRLRGETLFEIDASVNETSPQNSAVDIHVAFNNSKLSQHSSLHPFDLKAMESIVDLAMTDYVSSILKSQRMASTEELSAELKHRLGFSNDQALGFFIRIKGALKDAYPSRPASAAVEQPDREADRGSYYSQHDLVSAPPVYTPDGVEINPLASNDGD
jgi:hypothetical protein